MHTHIHIETHGWKGEQGGWDWTTSETCTECIVRTGIYFLVPGQLVCCLCLLTNTISSTEVLHVNFSQLIVDIVKQCSLCLWMKLIHSCTCESPRKAVYVHYRSRYGYTCMTLFFIVSFCVKKAGMAFRFDCCFLHTKNWLIRKDVRTQLVSCVCFTETVKQHYNEILGLYNCFCSIECFCSIWSHSLNGNMAPECGFIVLPQNFQL